MVENNISVASSNKENEIYSDEESDPILRAQKKAREEAEIDEIRQQN